VKSGSLGLLALVIVGLALCSYCANTVYDHKVAIVPSEQTMPTMFYAGMDKFLSNVSWMTLVQWEAEQTGKPDDAQMQALAAKLNALTNLDPRFVDAYIDGALSLGSHRADLATQLLDKAEAAGDGNDWRVPFYAGMLALHQEGDLHQAISELNHARTLPNAPPYVNSLWMHARARELAGDPIAVMDAWSGFITGLRPDQTDQRHMAIGEITDTGQQALDDCDSQLKTETDSKVREQLLNKRAEVQKRMKDFSAAPTTNPSSPDAA
jgi:hypothetical protein